VRLLSTTRSNQPASQRPTDTAAAATAFRTGAAGHVLHHLLGYYPSVHTATALVCTGLLLRFTRRLHPHWRSRLLAAVNGLDPHRRSVVGHPPLPLVHRRARRAAARDPNPGPDQQETHEPGYKRPQAGPSCSDGGDTGGSDVLRAAVTAGHERSGQSLDVGKEA